MLGGGGRLHVESCEGQPGELCGVGAHPTGGGVELGEKRTVLVVGVLALHDGEDGGVLQLPGPGVADRALVAGRGREARLGQVVALAEAGQDEGGIDRRDHVGEPDRVSTVLEDHLGHSPGFDGVPQLDDGEPGDAGIGEPFQLGDQVLAQRAACAVVDQRGLFSGQLTRSVAHLAQNGAVGRTGQVVMEGDAVGHQVQEALHDLAACLGAEPGDDDDRESGTAAHQLTPRRPYRRWKRSTGLRQHHLPLASAHFAPLRPPNIQRKRYWLPSGGRHVRLTLSAKAIKTVDSIGIEAAMARIRARGEKV